MKKISKELLTTIIAVGVAVVLVAAMFIPTIITLSKNNKKVDALDAQIADLKDLPTALTEEQIKELVESIINANRPADPDVVPPTFEESIAAGANITLEKDTVLTEDIFVKLYAETTIDLAGKTLTISEDALLEIYGTLNIVGNGSVIVEAGLGEDGEIQGIVVKDRGALNLKNVTLTMTGASAYGIVNEGTATVDGCDFIVGKDSTGFNCLIYNESAMIVKNSSFTEEATPKGYAHGAPIHNRGVLDMINVDIESTGYCTSSFGGRITVDSDSTLVLKGEKSLTPDGDYFAYNVHNFDEPTSNDCAEFKYLGEAEVNQINRDFKELFANGGSIILTEDAEIGSAFSAMSGKDITVDLGGKTLTFNENAYVTVSTDLVTFKNGTLIVETDSDDTLQCFEVLASGSLSIDGVEFINKSASMYAISNRGDLAINNSDFSIPADMLGASLTFVYNLGVAEISNSSFGNTAPDAKYTRCTPIDNYGRELTLTNVKIDSLSCCIYIAGTDAKIQLVDCELNCGTNAAEICTLKVNKGDIEHTVTRTENGAAKEVTFFYH